MKTITRSAADAILKSIGALQDSLEEKQSLVYVYVYPSLGKVDALAWTTRPTSNAYVVARFKVAG